MLQKWLKAQNLIDIAVQSSEGDVFEKFKDYSPHGMVQPAVLFVKPGMSVLAKWVQIPTEVCIITNLVHCQHPFDYNIIYSLIPKLSQV